MTVFLIVVGAIILLIAGILALRLTITVEYKDELRISYRILFLKFHVTPEKKKKVNYKKYTARKLRGIIARKKRKELARKKREERRAAKRKAAAKKRGELSDKKNIKPEKPSFIDDIKYIASFIHEFFERFAKHITVKIARVRITVASDDAAKTAVMYGIVSQSVAYIVEAFDNATKMKYKKDAEFSVDTDFTASKPSADIKLSFSLRITRAVRILFRLVMR